MPAFVTKLATPLTFSIATGLSLGLISYTVVKLAAEKFAEINTLIWILTALFILRYVLPGGCLERAGFSYAPG
jgi:AGZA family xanthine/uracil permease-like MFS transporter